MNNLFPGNKPQTTIDINEFEQVRVSGDYDNFDFDLFIYSEAFESWIKQDMIILQKFHKSFYDALTNKISKRLIKEGGYNEQHSEI